MNLEEKQLSSEQFYDGRIIKLYNDKVLLPNGKQSQREYVTHNGGCAIVPITTDNKVLMVEQYRYPYGEVVLEIPAGKLEVGEDADSCAVRELKEEVGGEAEQIIYLGKAYPSPGYTNEVLKIYLALGVRVGDTHFDEDEFLDIKSYDLSEAMDMIMNNQILDAKSIIGIMKAVKYMDNNKK